jgi:hypothetical protein
MDEWLLCYGFEYIIRPGLWYNGNGYGDDHDASYHNGDGYGDGNDMYHGSGYSNNLKESIRISNNG